MKKSLLSLLATCALFSTPAFADVMVHDPESFETAAGMKVGAALMGLHSDSDDRLVAATSPVSERVEIHTMSEENGVMKMRKIDGIDLPADKIVALEPSGNHLMLMNLKEPLKAGSEIEVTLQFEKGKPVTVKVPVKSRSEAIKKAGGTSDDKGHDHKHDDSHADHHNDKHDDKHDEHEGH